QCNACLWSDCVSALGRSCCSPPLLSPPPLLCVWGVSASCGVCSSSGRGRTHAPAAPACSESPPPSSAPAPPHRPPPPLPPLPPPPPAVSLLLSPYPPLLPSLLPFL